MWWHDSGAAPASARRAPAGTIRRGGPARLALILVLGAALGGCFQPLYGERAATPQGASIRGALASVNVGHIDAPPGTQDARLAPEIRNALLFSLTGGTPAPAPTHELTLQVRSSRLTTIVDITTSRPDLENYTIDANYKLVEIASGKTVMTGSTFARVSYDIPGSVQRFSRSRALRDAETRAAQVIADNIRQRLASYFVSGS